MASNDTLFVDNSFPYITAEWLNPINNKVFQGNNPIFVTTTGSANAQVLTLPATSLLSALVAGMEFVFIAGFTNTAATTLQIVGASAQTATAVRMGNSYPLQGGEIHAGDVCRVVYDGTYFQLTVADSSPQLSRGWLNGSVSAGTLTVNGSYNLSCSRTSQGLFAFTFTNALANANFSATATCYLSATVLVPSGPSTKATTGFNMTFLNASAAATDPTEFDVIVMGSR
jgi:hypothetical protein